MTETDYITLSDDDDEVPYSSNPSSSLMSSGVTAHIGEISQLDLSSIGITINESTESGNEHRSTYQRVQPLEVSKQGNNVRSQKSVGKTQAVTRVIHRQQPYATNQRAPPYFARKTNKISPNSGISIHQPPSPNLDIRRMFEATDESYPKRRSTRHADKIKIAGQFVCNYDPKKCVKVTAGPTEFITHIWTHVVNDYPETKERSKSAKPGSQFLQNDDPTCKEFLHQICTCQQCNATFKSVYLKQKHVKSCHIEPEKCDTVCNTCEKDLKSEGALKAHCYSHRPNEAPYICRKCKYRTSARKFLYEHYIEKHNQECLMCPICLFTIDFPTYARHRKMLFFDKFVDHMRDHSTYYHHCGHCALTFLTYDELETHKMKDHTVVPSTWRIKDRKHFSNSQRERGVRKSKIKSLQERFFKTTEGKRVEDEIKCSSSLERLGSDNSSCGTVLYVCRCGQMKSYNGNRMASHFHRCRNVYDEVVKKYVKRNEEDDEEEIKKFCVFPPFAGSEIMTQNSNRERVKKLKGQDDDDEITRGDDTVFPPLDDNMFLKLASTTEDMEGYVSKFMDLYAGK